jgi:endonuclease YncB( thermonuclease family)
LKLQWVLVALLWLGSLDALAKETVLGGQVSHVTDGDSLWLTPAAPAAPIELRLLGIDAPEICQAWGQEAKQALAELVLHQQVTVKTAGRDTYGRTLGTVYLDTLNVNKTMVQEGHAWSTRYKYDRGPYVADERMAKALSRGLNRDGGAIVPREFRRTHGPCTSEDVADAHAAGASLKPPPSAPAPAPTLADAGRRCDGRTRCSQMRSCEEATWFLRHCPGVQMDGNHDGVPCERQWCRP